MANDSRLGAPLGQHFQDFPVPDVLPLAVAAFFGLFSNHWPLIVNAVYLSSFPLIATSAWYVLRKMGVSTWVALVAALLYDLLPYHFVRGEIHLFLSCYYTVPFGVFLAWSVISGESLFSSRWISLRTIVFAMLVAMTDTYYAAFTIVLIFAGVAIQVLSKKQWKYIAVAAGVAVTLAGTVYVDTWQTTAYHRAHGSNIEVVNRKLGDTEAFGLKLTYLILPVEHHRINALADLRKNYNDAVGTSLETEAPALGLVGSFGFLWLIGVLFVGLVRRNESESAVRQRHLAILAGFGFMVGTVGGFASIIGLLVDADIRSWDRISIFIGFISLASIGLLFDSLYRRFSSKILMAATLVLLLIAGTLDQTNDASAPPYQLAGSTYNSDKAFFMQIQNSLPANSAVFELPIDKFPEAGPINNVTSYDLLRPYLTTTNLRWSFGGIEGRLESEWQMRLANASAQALVDGAVSTGFKGLYIDRDGYTDHGAALEMQISDLLGGEQPLVGQNGSGSYFDLENYAASIPQSMKQNISDTLLYPVYANREWSNFYSADVSGYDTYTWAKGGHGSLVVGNADPTSKTATVSFGLRAGTGSANFTIKWPDGQTSHLSAGTTAVTVTRTLMFPKNYSNISITTDAAPVYAPTDTRDLRFQVKNFVVGQP